MAQTMAMGQAAGTAAALSLRSDCSARNVNQPELQEQLRISGAVLETPGEIAHTAAGDWQRNLLASR